MILFDEIYALVLDRTNSNDLRETGIVTSTILQCLNNSNKKIILITTTNLYDYLNKELVRRFDFVVDFNRYTNKDLLNIAEVIFNKYSKEFDNISKNIRLFKKIISSYEKIPYPRILENVIRTSLDFSDPNSKFDYPKRLYKNVIQKGIDLNQFKKRFCNKISWNIN
ncbi:AAA family ATPase [Mycoplasma mycoides]|uniref:AAA family ATPase n=1 Tax=Mycoplasma mycoides TaxID=2102 RepID=UPI002AD3A65C|nr:AAA family ATPase [Mycoplasma mycoides]